MIFKYNKGEIGIQQIEDLIILKQEGPYWDFKKEWYSKDKNSDLLHDIICMANNLEDRDSFIIIGIDEENDYMSRNVKDDTNRKNTQKIVDFLKDKKFAGGIRPTVFVKTILLDGNCIDVIVIKNSYNTPFYLNERYQDVEANNIYTRVMNTNTPKKKSADIHHVEYLWKKRFRLVSTPLERIEYYLKKPDDWLDSPTDWKRRKNIINIFRSFQLNSH